MRVRRISAILLSLLLLAGCWDSMDINNRNIITAVVYDQDDEACRLHIEIAVISSGEQDGESSNEKSKSRFTVVTGKGKSIVESRDILESKLARPLFLGATRALIITQAGAEHGIEEYLYRVREDPEYRKTISIVTTTEEGAGILEAKPINVVSAGFAVEDLLESMYQRGHAYYESLENIIEIFARPYRAFVIPCVGIKDELLVFVGYNVFKEDKTVGFIPYEESKGLTYLKTDNATWIYEVPYEDKRASIEAKLQKRTITPKYKDGELSFTIKFKFDAQLKYTNVYFQITDDIREKLTASLQKTIYDEITAEIARSQFELNSDYLRFDNYFRISYPNEKLDWETEYPKAKMNVEISLNLNTSGSIEHNFPVKSQEGS